MDTTKLLLIAGFLLVAAIWYFNMTYSLKEFYGHFARRKRFPLSVMWAIIFVAQVMFDIVPISQGEMAPYFHRTGLVFYFIGIMFAIWGRISMGSIWGIPAQHDIKRQNYLITKGAFEYSRNPIYTGMLIAFFGFELALNSWLILLVIPLVMYIRSIIETEERFMEQHFGDEWQEYKERVTRFFIIV